MRSSDPGVVEVNSLRRNYKVGQWRIEGYMLLIKIMVLCWGLHGLGDRIRRPEMLFWRGLRFRMGWFGLLRLGILYRGRVRRDGERDLNMVRLQPKNHFQTYAETLIRSYNVGLFCESDFYSYTLLYCNHLFASVNCDQPTLLRTQRAKSKAIVSHKFHHEETPRLSNPPSLKPKRNGRTFKVMSVSDLVTGNNPSLVHQRQISVGASGEVHEVFPSISDLI